MGSIKAQLVKFFRSYNAAKRAEKIIDENTAGMRAETAPRHSKDKAPPLTAEQLADITEKRPDLDGRVDQIDIKVTYPPEPEKSDRQLPSKEMERRFLGLPEPEYRFYEPPPDEIPDGKLSFREALQLLSAKKALNMDEHDEIAHELLNTHQAARRMDPDDLENMLTYFAPFESVGQQLLLSQNQLGNLEHEKYDNWKAVLAGDSEFPGVIADSEQKQRKPSIMRAQITEFLSDDDRTAARRRRQRRKLKSGSEKDDGNKEKS